MANLNVTYDQMQSAAGRLRDGQSELEANLQRLRQLVAQLVQDGFTTTRASGAFDASYTEFTTGATKTVQGIEGMASFLEKAAQALQSTDEQLASQLGQWTPGRARPAGDGGLADHDPRGRRLAWARPRRVTAQAREWPSTFTMMPRRRSSAIAWVSSGTVRPRACLSATTTTSPLVRRPNRRVRRSDQLSPVSGAG